LQDIKTFLENHKTVTLIIAALLVFIGSYFLGRYYANVAVQEAQSVQIAQDQTSAKAHSLLVPRAMNEK
jgi:membrane protein DedA with SNARE-associated domain